MDLITLADLPELAGTEAKPRSTIVIGRLDDNLRDPRYGKFAITQRQVDGWKRNLSETFGGQVSIDFDHSSDRGSGTRAAAWIKDIGQDGKLITADVEFSKRGARAVRNGDYRYTSPTFVENYVDEHGVKHGPALIGAALTNRPVLRKGMPTLSLSRDTFEGVATVSSKRERKRARELARSRDSRPQMNQVELAKLLDLEPDADEATILAKVTELKGTPETDEAKAQRKAAKKAAKQLAKSEQDDKPVTLSTLTDETLAQLLLDANAGASAATQLAEQTFNTAWDKALSEGRAAPSQEDTLRELHAQNPELAIKTLDAFVKIVPTIPAGSGEAGANAGPAPLGMDDERFALHTEAKQLAQRKMSTDSTLQEDEAYILAVQEIEERKFSLENPGI